MMILTPHNNPTATGPTLFMTERNQHEARCHKCKRPIYVDDKTYRQAKDSIKSGLDDHYLCEVCEEDNDGH